MAVYAIAQVTIAVTVDVARVDPFYATMAVTGAQPTIDTSTATPSGWSATEPAFDSTKQLWVCHRTTLSDGTFYWSAVSRSSGYSGANAAWNKADAMQSAAIVSSTPVYYRSTGTLTPGISSFSAISESPSVSDAWTYAMPDPLRGCSFWTCDRVVHGDGSVSFTAVRAIPVATYQSRWCAEADATYIDGGMLYAESVTASQFAARSVTADKLAVGAITVGALSDEVAGLIDGAVEAAGDAAGLFYDYSWTLSNGTYRFEASARRGGVDITDGLPDEFFHWWLQSDGGTVVELSTGTPTGTLVDGPTLSLPASAAGYRAEVVGGMEESVDFALVGSDGEALCGSDGEWLIGTWVA